LKKRTYQYHHHITFIRDDGKRTTYAPRIPAIAPDAPTVGVVEEGLNAVCAREAAIPVPR